MKLDSNPWPVGINLTMNLRWKEIERRGTGLSFHGWVLKGIMAVCTV